MSLIPRRGPARQGQPGMVAVHPGWTLSPTSVAEGRPAPAASVVGYAPAQPAVPVELVAPVAVVVDPEVAPVVVVPAAPISNSWTSEWEAVAATPAAPLAPLALHTAATAALDAVFGAAPAAWMAAPAHQLEQPHPAPLVVPALAALRGLDLAELPLPLSALDAPLPPGGTDQLTPIEAELLAPPRLAPPPTSPPPAYRPTMAPPTSPPPSRRPVVPAPAQQVLDRAIRNAPSVAPQRRATVRLGFTDASAVDLRPDDPIAKALHTVAAALMGRDAA